MSTRLLDTQLSLYDTQYMALALLYGPPNPQWLRDDVKWGNFYRSDSIPLPFHEALVKVFGIDSVRRVSAWRMAYDYAAWYQLNNKEDV